MELPNSDGVLHPHESGAHNYCNTFMQKDHVAYDSVVHSVKVTSNNHLLWTFFKCKMCLYKTKYFELMRNHLKRHRVTKRSKMFNCQIKYLDQYKCSVLGCEYRSNMLVNFNKHVLISHCDPIVKSEDVFTECSRKVLMNTSWNNLIKKYNCESCSFSTHSQLLYVSHYKQCPVKNFLKENPVEKEPAKIKRKETFYNCSICVYRTKKKGFLENHMETRHPFPEVNTKKLRKVFKCTKCPYKTTRAFYYKKHYTDIHKETSDGQETHTEELKICVLDKVDDTIPSVSKIKRKKMTKTSRKIQNNMKKSQKEAHYKYISEEIIEISDDNSPDEPESQEIPAIVPVVSMSVDQDSTYIPASKKFIRTKLSPRRRKARPVYYCWKCPFKSYFISGYVNHLSHRHFGAVDIQWITCDLCKYKTIFPSQLKRHIITKHPATFKCTMCTFYGSSSRKLKMHILKQHITPNEVKKFSCKSCDLKFLKHEDLKDHILAYHVSTETVVCFICQLCSYRTIEEEDLKEHVLEKHVDPQGTEWANCEMCECKFRHSDHLKKHIFEKHIM